MKRFVPISLCALMLSLAQASAPGGGVAVAAENGPPPALAPTPSAKAVDYARRYLVAIRMDETIRLMMDALGPMLVEAEAGRRPGLTTAEKTALLSATTESMVAIMPQFTEIYALELAAIFSEDELRQLAEFYESPVGRSVTAKTKLMSQAGERAMTKLLPELTEDMLERLCKRIDCQGPTARPTDSQAS